MTLFQIRVDHFVHLVDADVPGRVAALEARVEELAATQTAQQKELDTMSQLEQRLTDAVARLNDETTKIGTKLDALAAEIANGVTPARGAEIAKAMEDLGDRLDVMAQDPNNPVPNPVPGP